MAKRKKQLQSFVYECSFMNDLFFMIVFDVWKIWDKFGKFIILTFLCVFAEVSTLGARIMKQM